MKAKTLNHVVGVLESELRDFDAMLEAATDNQFVVVSEDFIPVRFNADRTEASPAGWMSATIFQSESEARSVARRVRNGNGVVAVAKRLPVAIRTARENTASVLSQIMNAA